MQNILIIGATSSMAESVARIYAARGCRLYLAARNQARLAHIADDLRIRGAAEVLIGEFSAEDRQAHSRLVDDVWESFPRIDVALVAHGALPDQEACEAMPEMAAASLEVNAGSVVSILGWISNRFEKQGGGTIGIISSVAGDRGRKSNYIYGAAKAMVNAYASGLRHRFFNRGVTVTLIKPGFVDTPMTAHLRKGLLWASSEKAGYLIVRALDRRQSVAYVPGFWRWIMIVVRSLPESLFLRTEL